MRKIVLILILTQTSYSSAQFYKGGGGPHAFYQVSFIPRETAMVGGVASAIDVFSPYINPAGMIDSFDTFRTKFALGIISRLNYFQNLHVDDLDLEGNFDFFAIGLKYRTKNRAIGLNLVQLAVKNINQTKLNINDEIEKIGEFNTTEALYILTYAEKAKNMDFGFNSKFCLYDFTLHGSGASFSFAGADLGLKFFLKDSLVNLSKISFGLISDTTKTLFNDIHAGAVVRFTRDGINSDFLIVSGFYSKIPSISRNFLAQLELSAGNYSPFRASFGFEYMISNSFLIRGGSNFNCISFGIGLRLGIIIADIAFTTYFSSEEGEYLAMIDSPLKIGLQLAF